MLKKVFGLASLLLLLTFVGAACTPAASQKDLQDLQFQVQALSAALESTQKSLSATQEALRSMQKQNQQLQNQLGQATSKCSTCDKAAQTCINNNVATQSGYVFSFSSYYPYTCSTCSCQLPCQYTSPCTPLCYSLSSWRYACYHLFSYLFCARLGHWRNHPHVPPYPEPHPSPCPEPHPSPCPNPHPSPCPEPHPSPCPNPHPSPCPGPPRLIDFPHPIAVEATADTVATEPMAASAITTADLPATASPETTTEPVLPTPTSQVVIDSAEPAPAPETALATYPVPAAVPDPVAETRPPAPAAIEPPIIIEFTIEPAPSTLQTVEATNEPTPDCVVAATQLPEIVTEPALPESTSVAVTETMPVVRPIPAMTETPVITKVPAVPETSISEIEEAMD